MAGLGASFSKKTPQGRSVEEVILMRKLGESRVQLPAIKTSQSTNSLPVGLGKQDSLPPSTYQPNRLRTAGTKEVLYTESDVRRMMEEVMQYTRALQNRVQHLEEELLVTNRNRGTRASTAQSPEEGTPVDLRASKTSFPAPQPASTHASSQAVIRQKAVSLAHDAILNIDAKVVNLKDIFRRKDPLEERTEAAIRIQSLIRRYLVLSRKRSFESAQRDWRWQRCRPVVWLLDILLSNQSKLDTGFHLLRMNRTMRTLLVFFGKWAFISRQNAPVRLLMRENAAQRIEQTRLRLLRKVFDGLREVSIGSLSTKKAILERRVLMDRIRADLSSELQAAGLVGVVPEDEVFRVLHRKVVEQFHDRKKVLVKKFKFHAMARLVTLAQRNDKAAARHHFRKLAGRCFYAWSDYVYLKARGLDRKRWPGPRKYEVRYNQKRVDHFARLRCERFVFSAWKAYFSVQLQVKRRFQAKKAAFVAAVFGGWRLVASEQRVLRRRVYDNWKGYARLLTCGPFQAWADHVRGLKTQYQEHLRLAKAYRRWKLRQRLFVVVKTWRHQALFGRVDGLYTRQMLLRTLGEQKLFASSLEKAMADQLLELDDCKRAVASELAKRQAGEAELARLQADAHKLRMTLHHYEQELRRLQAVLQTLATINPKHVDHIAGLQADFKFKERHLALGDATGTGAGDTGTGTGPSPAGTTGTGTGAGVPEGQVSGGLDPAGGGGGPGSGALLQGEGGVAAGVVEAAGGVDGLPTVSGRLEAPAPRPPPLQRGETQTTLASLPEEGDGDAGEGRGDASPHASDAADPPTGTGTHTVPTATIGPTSGTTADPASGTDHPTVSEGVPDAGPSVVPVPVPSRPASPTAAALPPGSGQPAASLSAEEASLLRRVRWLLSRYREALPEQSAGRHLVLAPALRRPGGGGEGEEDGASLCESQASGGPSMSTRSSLLRASLLRPTAPPVFLRPATGTSFSAAASLDGGSLVSQAYGDSLAVATAAAAAGLPASPTRRSAAVRRPSAAPQPGPASGASFSVPGASASGSASLLSQAMQAAVSAALSAASSLDGPASGPPGADLLSLPLSQAQGEAAAAAAYYSDGELESLVVGWARMLVAFFDFLGEGDVTGLPLDDRRRWARHCLDAARSSSSNNNNGGEAAEGEARAAAGLSTVDESLGGAGSWRQALLALRTMFPGSGNFSGLGVELTSPREVSFGQRVLAMQADLAAIERRAADKHQKLFVHKHLPPAAAASLPGAGSGEGEEREEEGEGGGEGMGVYASNLSRLAALQERQAEAQRRLRSVDHAVRASLPRLLGGEGDDGDGDDGDGPAQAARRPGHAEADESSLDSLSQA